MTSGKAMGSGTKAAIVVAGILGVVLLASLIWKEDTPREAANVGSAPASSPASNGVGQSATETVVPASEAAPETAAEPVPSATPAEVSAAVPAPVPGEENARVTIDNWRVEADGAGLISGRAAPQAEVSVLLDEVEVARGVAQNSGDFVILFTLPANDDPGLLTLRATLPDGSVLDAPEAIALGPIPGPIPALASEPAGEAFAEAAPEGADAAPEAAPATILVTEDGAKAIAPTAPAALAEGAAPPVMVSVISYATDGAVQLSGQGAAGQTVRIYLDNALVAEAGVQADRSWQAVLGETAPGIYTLRADQVDGEGKVTARFETPFKRETVEALAALAEPAASAGAEPQLVADPEPEAGPAPQVEMAAAPESAAESAPQVTTQSAPASDPKAETTAGVAAEPAAESAAGPAVQQAAETKSQQVSITVQPGYSLWKIARDAYGEGVLYVQVYEANRDKIRDPDLIYPGQVFALPAP